MPRVQLDPLIPKDKQTEFRLIRQDIYRYRAEELAADQDDRQVIKDEFVGTYWHDPVGWARDCIIWKPGEFLAPYQQEILGALPEHRRVSFRSLHGAGKDLEVTTSLPTPTGWTTMGAVQVDDWLLDEAGRPCRVTCKPPPMWRDAYEVRFDDGSMIVAGATHDWVAVPVDRPGAGGTKITTEAMARTVRTADGQFRWVISTSAPLTLPPRTVVSVTPVGQRFTQCVAVDAPSHLFLAGESMIPTHNTTSMAIAVLWFSLTRDVAGADWKIPTTASVWRQLQDFLWPEIHKWARRLDWEQVGRAPFKTGTELLKMSLKLDTGAAFAVASDDPASIEGAHADEILYIFDESKALGDATFDAAEGAFSTGNAYAMAVSTPGEPVGRFYDIHARKPGLEDWWVKHVTLAETIAAGRVNGEWARQRALLWGEDSAVYKNRVLGEFAGSDEDSVIPLAWIEMAQERWRQQYTTGVDGEFRGVPVQVNVGTRRVLEPGEKVHIIGLDVARGGADRTVAALRQGNTICELRRFPYSDDTMATAHLCIAIQDAHQSPKAVVDVIGIGAGVYDRIREERRPCSPFNASNGTTRRDFSGEFGFSNFRSFAHWNAREMLDPNLGCDVALPPDDRLTGDLVTPKWRVMSGGRIQVESKDEIKKRIGRSPDDGDAVIMALSDSGGSWADLYRDEPPETVDEDGVAAPRAKPSRSGGWGGAYQDPDDTPTPAGPPVPGGGYFGAAPKSKEPPRSGWYNGG